MYVVPINKLQKLSFDNDKVKVRTKDGALFWVLECRVFNKENGVTCYYHGPSGSVRISKGSKVLSFVDEDEMEETLCNYGFYKIR